MKEVTAKGQQKRGIDEDDSSKLERTIIIILTFACRETKVRFK